MKCGTCGDLGFFVGSTFKSIVRCGCDAGDQFVDALRGLSLRFKGGVAGTKTPADRLADVVFDLVSGYDRVTFPRLNEALDAYRSTRNGVGYTVAEAFGFSPDPVLVARFLLDSLTDGSLSSLICQMRDAMSRTPPGDIGSFGRWIDLGPHGIDNVKANLRALGEKIE